jgi:hypothetical protein|tara:strand:- start:168 stop:479 length:312 start_codon:yes stop_codon:yes gene_type:complete
MGQNQQKMKLFETSTPTPTPSLKSSAPLFIDTSNISRNRSTVQLENQENNTPPSAFQSFLTIAPTKSWLAAGGVMMRTPTKQKMLQHHPFSGSPSTASPGFGR